MNSFVESANKSLWTELEDALLIESAEQNGANGNWHQIALQVGSRSGSQCRQRYINLLEASIASSTNVEDAIVKRMFQENSRKWGDYMDHLPGRYHVITPDADSDSANTVSPSKIMFEEPNLDAKRSALEAADTRLERLRSVRELFNEQIEALALVQAAQEAEEDVNAQYQPVETSRSSRPLT